MDFGISTLRWKKYHREICKHPLKGIGETVNQNLYDVSFQIFKSLTQETALSLLLRQLYFKAQKKLK